jgi:hypothetical protein
VVGGVVALVVGGVVVVVVGGVVVFVVVAVAVVVVGGALVVIVDGAVLPGVVETLEAVVESVVATVVVNCCVTAGVTLDVAFWALQPYKAEKRINKIRSTLRKTAAQPLKNCFKNFFILTSMLFALSINQSLELYS